MALTALELAATDRYAGKETARRRDAAVKKVVQAKGTMSKRKQRQIENVSFADLLKYMVHHDGLTDEQIALNTRCGPPSRVLGLLMGRPGQASLKYATNTHTARYLAAGARATRCGLGSGPHVVMSEMGPGCVKTCERRERPEIYSKFPSSDARSQRESDL